MTAVAAEAPVCVIGAGVMGLSAAFRIASAGTRVLVLERGVPGQEASAANAGTLSLQNKPFASLPIVMRSVEMWRGLSQELEFDIEYERRGGLRLACSVEDAEKLQAAVAAQRAAGLAVELLDGGALRREAPYLGPDVIAASYCADDGMANPLATTRALLAACARLGTTVWTQCGVDRIEVRGDHDFVLHTPRGLVRTPIVLSATGAWNPDIARLLGLSLPIGTEVQQVLTTTAGAPVFPHIISHIRGNLTAKQSRGTGKILIGGAWPGDGDRATGCKRVRRDSVIGNLRWAVRHIPAIARTRLLRAWVGFEGRTPDKLLISGPVDGLPGFYLLGCASGGFTTAPIGGVIAARYVAALPPDPDWTPYLVSRLLPTPASTTIAAQTREAGE